MTRPQMRFPLISYVVLSVCLLLPAPQVQAADDAWVFPDTLAGLKELAGRLRKMHLPTEQDKERLKPEALRMLSAFYEQLSSERSITVDKMDSEAYLRKMEVRSDSRVFLHGDVHGGLDGLLAELAWCVAHGVMNERLELEEGKFFVFHGDLVDRGPHSLHTLLLIIQLKLRNPQQVILVRGNHETEPMCGSDDPRSLRSDLLKHLPRYDATVAFLGALQSFALLPSALFLGRPAAGDQSGGWYMLNHGGLALGVDLQPFLDSPDEWGRATLVPALSGEETDTALPYLTARQVERLQEEGSPASPEWLNDALALFYRVFPESEFDDLHEEAQLQLKWMDFHEDERNLDISDCGRTDDLAKKRGYPSVSMRAAEALLWAGGSADAPLWANIRAHQHNEYSRIMKPLIVSGGHCRMFEYTDWSDQLQLRDLFPPGDDRSTVPSVQMLNTSPCTSHGYYWGFDFVSVSEVTTTDDPKDWLVDLHLIHVDGIATEKFQKTEPFDDYMTLARAHVADGNCKPLPLPEDWDLSQMAWGVRTRPAGRMERVDEARVIYKLSEPVGPGRYDVEVWAWRQSGLRKDLHEKKAVQLTFTQVGEGGKMATTVPVSPSKRGAYWHIASITVPEGLVAQDIHVGQVASPEVYCDQGPGYVVRLVRVDAAAPASQD